jgi:hypothetical protein
MNTRRVNAAADVICRAMENGRRVPAAMAVALESAQMLMSPEMAAEMEQLQNRVAELEQELAALTAQNETLRAKHADGITRRIVPVQVLREEGEHEASVRHSYRLGRDLPPIGGVL